MKPSTTRLAAAGLVVATFLAYLPAWRGGFLWDDDSWTTLIADLLRDTHGLWRLWTVPTALQQYYPLSGTTFWLDHHLWGDWTLPYHLECIALHAIGALLFWRLLSRLEVPGAPFAGAIFALHPVMVESVAWITERKNVLSLPLYLGALLCYARFTSNWQPTTDNGQPTDNPPPATRHPPPLRWYAAAFVLFLAALTAKVTAFSLPAVILLLCWWKRGRIRWRADFLPTLPFFALSLLFGATVSHLEKQHLGAQGSDFAFTLPQRLLLAGRVLWFYPAKLLWPAYQAFIYPRWNLEIHSFGQWLYPATALPVFLLPFFLRHRFGRGPATALWFYAGTLLPVTGLFNGYFMLYSFVWDHLVYVSSLGIIALAAATLTLAASHLRQRWQTRNTSLQNSVILTRVQRAESLVHEPSLRDSRRQTDEGKPSGLRQRTDPSSNDLTSPNPLPPTTDNRQPTTDNRQPATRHPPPASLYFLPSAFCLLLLFALTWHQSAMYQSVFTLYRTTIRQNPAAWLAYGNLGSAMVARGEITTGISFYETALLLRPSSAEIRNNLANALARTGNLGQAITQYELALSANPGMFGVHANLAAVLQQTGRLDEAIVHYRLAAQTGQDRATALVNLGDALLQKGADHEAAATLTQAFALRPTDLGVGNDLAYLLATSQDPAARNAPRALALATSLNAQTHGTEPLLLRTLAAAQAASDQLPAALATARRALTLAAARHDEPLAAALRTDVTDYLSHFPSALQSPSLGPS